MRRLIALALGLAIAGDAAGQVAYPPSVTVDQVVAQVQAAAPPVCTDPPPSPGMTATAGTDTACVRRKDATPATQVPPATATTASDGTFSGTWPAAFASPPSRALATVDGATSYHCQIITKTATAFTGKCWLVSTSMTLPTLATSLLGYVIPFLTSAAGGLTVNVFARQ